MGSHFLNVTNSYIFLYCGIKFREALENCSDMPMVFDGIVSPDIDAIYAKAALVEVQYTEKKFCEC